jgi:FkbM family methyltransferase
MDFTKMAWKLSERAWLRGVLTPLTRAFLRYWPFRAGKEPLWRTFVLPCLAWRPRAFTAVTRFGSRMKGDTRDVVQQCIYFFGAWEPAVTQWIGSRLKPGDVFVDVGANIGYFSLLGSKAVGRSGKVVAIEASPLIFRSLQQNLGLNAAENVRAVNVAAAERAGKIALFHGTDYNSGVTTTVAKGGLDLHGEVDALPLSAVLETDESERARLIKIDIEGGEWSALAGAADLFPKIPATAEWVVELHPAQLRAIGKTGEDVVALFAGAGYLPYHLQNYASPSDCIAPWPSVRATRFAGVIDQEMVVVFSRTDAESL